MCAHRLEATVSPLGELRINELPFQPGEAVEIIILALEDAINASSHAVQEAPPSGLSANRAKQTKKPKRQTTLTAIQRGKYAQFLMADDRLPSEAFALNKEEEKAQEERRWMP